jgi:hypothetical protein
VPKLLALRCGEGSLVPSKPQGPPGTVMALRDPQALSTTPNICLPCSMVQVGDRGTQTPGQGGQDTGTDEGTEGTHATIPVLSPAGHLPMHHWVDPASGARGPCLLCNAPCRGT